ncbi:MAG: OmpH family outer membrane protein [Candidatus Omnitrophica bacterium]|nr:OmpH family outer membrane protein [Candidatus Omnitrophota bacterium]
MRSLKGIVAVLICAAFVLSSAPIYAAGLQKVAYVDVAKVFNEYERTKDSETTINAKSKTKQEERDAIVRDIRSLKDELVLLSDSGKAEKQKAIDEKIKALDNFDREVGKALGQERDEAIRQIFESIDKAVKDYGKKNGYDMIFNERFLLYYQPEYDVTNDILNTINKEYQATKGKKK